MYATLDDMTARFGTRELVETTDDEQTGLISAARIETALSNAATTINGYVAVQYRTGGVPVPPLLTEIACDIARFRMYRNTGAPERIEKAHDRAMGMLTQIAAGKIKLDAGEETLVARPGVILVSRPARVFGRDDMGGY